MQFNIPIARVVTLNGVQKERNILKFYYNSHTYLTETPSFAWYLAAALKRLP